MTKPKSTNRNHRIAIGEEHVGKGSRCRWLERPFGGKPVMCGDPGWALLTWEVFRRTGWQETEKIVCENHARDWATRHGLPGRRTP